MNIVRWVTGIIKLKGDTDNTKIGNVGDSLKTNVTASALPTGGATSAKQTTGNASLSSIDGKVSTAANQTTGNASLSSIDSKLTDNATAAKQDTGNTSLSNIDGKVSTEAKQDTGNTSLSNIDGKVSTAAKQDTANASLASINGSVSTSANQVIVQNRVGDLTETAPASDTASSGLNGRLQRIAQRLTSIFTAQSDGTQQSKIKGNTDGTLIGNSDDRLKTQPLDNKGATTAYSGTATTTVANVPAAAGQPINHVLIRVFDKFFEVSFDGGTTYLALDKNDAFTWDVKGEPTQLKIRTTSGTAEYRILLNTEEV